MSLDALGAGKNAPEEFNVVIEIAAGGPPVKYEVDKETGLLMVDRFMNVAMHYPCNYGYVPKTLYDDGDPVDVLVLTPYPVLAGSIIKCRAVGYLNTEDEKGMDAKILAVPVDKVSNNYYTDMQDLKDAPERINTALKHFHEHYKDLEKGKWVKVTGWHNAAEAKVEIAKSIAAYK